MKAGSLVTTDEIGLEIEDAPIDAAGAEVASFGTTVRPTEPDCESPASSDSGLEVKDQCIPAISENPRILQHTLCPNCQSSEDWGGGSWCPACGYHAALGLRVEAAIAEEPEPDTGPANLWEAIPHWVWAMLLGIVGIVALSIAVRLSLVGNDVFRARWALAQAALAEFAAILVHVLAYLYAAEKSDRVSPFDVVLKPIAIWKPTFASLPRYAWRVWTFAWAETAFLCALLIIGGLSYSALFDDWGVKKRASMNTTQAIAEQARRNSSGEDSLTDAVKEAASASAADLAANPDPTDHSTPEADALPTVECLIVGYRKDSRENPTTLLLATAVGRKMQYVGMISTFGIPREEVEELRQRLPKLEQNRPFVKCRYPAVWLKPVLLCEVEFEEWTNANRLRRPKFKQMLGDVQLR